MITKKIKVLITDDSAVVRKMISTYLGRYDDIEIVGTAVDPYDARDKIVQLKPDVLTLDIEMPKMDGISFLQKLMTHHPIPTIMVSSLTQEGSKATLRALEAGAVDFVGKPSASSIGSTAEFIEDLHQKVMAASLSNVKRHRIVSKPVQKIGSTAASAAAAAMAAVSPFTATTSGGSKTLIAIGASTGGTEALKEVLIRMPKNSPGIVIVQHMPELFTKYFAERLNGLSELEVIEARDGMPVKPGTALLAPGNFHMEVKKTGTSYNVHINQQPLVNRHRPSVEVLFNSVAKWACPDAIGVIMTGMGGDGAQGMVNMRNAGAKTIAQNQESCVVFGMPKEAIRLGGAEKVVDLYDIPKTICSLLK